MTASCSVMMCTGLKMYMYDQYGTLLCSIITPVIGAHQDDSENCSHAAWLGKIRHLQAICNQIVSKILIPYVTG